MFSLSVSGTRTLIPRTYFSSGAVVGVDAPKLFQAVGIEDVVIPELEIGHPRFSREGEDLPLLVEVTSSDSWASRLP